MVDEIIKLKVMEALQEEAYKGIVRMDSQTMRDLGVRAGDIVGIEGGRKTVGIVDRAYPSDVGQNIIRMDGILRRNAKTSIGENVIVSRIEVKEAKNITIAPAQQGLTIQAPPDYFKRGLIGRAVVKGDQISLGGARRRRTAMEGSVHGDIFDMFDLQDFSSFGLGLSGLKFIVVNAEPKQAVIITENTEISLNSKAVEVLDEKIVDITYEDVGGLIDEVKKVREMVELPLKHPELFERLGIDSPKGVLLHGPPGTGKTLLARAVANETNAHFIPLDGPSIMNKFVGEAEKRIREIFDEAEKNAPSIIFIDEIDAITPKREDSTEVERRVVAQLLAVMDGSKSRGKVIVIAATNRPNSLDPALRRPGRFDREIEIGVPKPESRLEILKIHTRNMPLKDVNLEELSKVTHGFVGADLEVLCKEAAMVLLRRLLPEMQYKKDEPIPKELLEKLIITMDDFKEGLKIVRPSAMREVFVESPSTTWNDIGGLEDVKQELKEAVEMPLKTPDVFKRMGVRPPRGILLYGPPGTGKTLIAKAVTNETKANFISVTGAELLSKWVNETPQIIKKIFEKARQVSPCVLFIDEIDNVAPRRNENTHEGMNAINQLLIELDGLQELNDVVIIGATNRPDIIDSALLRPGRFDRLVLVNVPDQKSRLKIFEIHTKGMPLAKDVNLKLLAEKSDNYVGADIQAVCREAAIFALRKDIKADSISMKNFNDALKKVKPSVTIEEIKKYEEIGNELATARAAEINDKKETMSYMG